MKYLSAITVSTLLFSIANPQLCFANSFGVYDARTQAMGGTAVAVGTVNNGHYYNPALTAFHIGTEESTRDGRHSLHVVANFISDGATEAASTISESLDGQLGGVIDRLNRSLEPYSDAESGFQLANELSKSIRAIDNLTIGADVYAGYSVSEPSDRKGGAFYIGTRIFATGVSNIENSDYQLLSDYIELFDYLRSDGANGEAHPELSDLNGNLIDPSTLIRSSALGTAVAKSEMAMSFAKVFDLWGQELSIGAAPKVVHLRIYDTRWQLESGSLARGESDIQRSYFNADVGIALNLGDSLRFGLAIKDVMTKDVTTELGNRLSFGTYKRFGMAYFHPRFTFGLDVDLGSSPDIQLEFNRKDISGGAEIRFKEDWMFRFGYRKDIQGIADDNFSLGLAWNYKYIAIETGYNTNGESQGGSLEISYIH